MNDYTEPVAIMDTRVIDGTVYVALPDLYTMNSTLALAAVLGLPPASHGPIAWALERYLGFYTAIELKHALDVVPETPEPFTR